MTMLSFIGPILVLAMGIDYAIHSLHRYQEERRNDASPKDAAKLSITHVGAAIFLATVTTTAAFFSNILSSIPAIQEFGILIGIGIICAFIVMGIFIPALRLILDNRKSINTKTFGTKDTKDTKKIPFRGFVLSWLKKEKKLIKSNTKKEKKKDKKHGLAHSISKITKKPKIVFLIVIFITIVSIYGALQVGTEFSPKDFLPEDSESLAAMDLMQEHFPQSGTESAEILIEGDVSNPEVLKALEETVENMKNDKHVSIIGSKPRVVCICPYVNEVMQNSTFREENNIDD